MNRLDASLVIFFTIAILRGYAIDNTPLRNEDLLADAEVGEDIVKDGVTCDVGSRDFAYGRDSTTQVGRQQICGEAIR